MNGARRARCIATRKDGRGCKATALRGRAYCRWHHPKVDPPQRPTDSIRAVPLWGGPGDGLKIDRYDLLEAAREAGDSSDALPLVLHINSVRFTNLDRPVVLVSEVAERDLEPGVYVLEQRAGAPPRYRWQATAPPEDR